MTEPKNRPADDDAGTRIYPDMANYAGSEAEFVAAVAKGIADLDAGRTVPFEFVAARLRRDYGKA